MFSFSLSGVSLISVLCLLWVRLCHCKLRLCEALQSEGQLKEHFLFTKALDKSLLYLVVWDSLFELNCSNLLNSELKESTDWNKTKDNNSEDQMSKLEHGSGSSQSELHPKPKIIFQKDDSSGGKFALIGTVFVFVSLLVVLVLLAIRKRASFKKCKVNSHDSKICNDKEHRRPKTT